MNLPRGDGIELSSELAGLKMRNPTMLASGILGMSRFTLEQVASAGAGAVVTKSICSKSEKGYSNPTIVEVDCGYLNAMGLPNPGVEVYTSEIIELRKSVEIPIVASVYGGDTEEFAYVASKLEKAGARAIEANVSCPHAKVGSMGQDPDCVRDVARAIKEAIRVPLFVKLNPNVTSIVKIAKAAVEGGCDGITAINTVRGMAIDIDACLPILGNRYGGLSGPAIKPIAVRCIYELYENVKVPLIGVGGVDSWEDAVEFFLAGASSIQVGTALAKGLSVFNEIMAGLRGYMRRKGFRNLREIIGRAHR
nr:dihydroorotate dehydrogenase [Candidatus Njordarchaeum guaymaensis]